jgi:aldehyde dehydrogenase (NAD+)
VDASSNETISIYSPHDESLVAEGIQVASSSDVDRAVDAAKAAVIVDPKATWRCDASIC